MVGLVFVAILVGQRRSRRHLGARRLAVQIVAVDEPRAQRRGQTQPDRCLARAGNAHHDDREALRDRR